jgi:UDP-N-acetylmuramate--alanine ligase
VQNALAAVAVGLELELTPEQIRRGLDHFRGADRRFQIKAELEGVTIVDDYGHHPTEIRATLEAARLWAAKRLVAIFQPHRYTRTLFLMDDFANSFQATDRVYVLDIYPASEKPISGVTSQRLVERMAELGFQRARYVPSEQAVIREVLEDLRPGDLILTVGAGSVGRISDALAEAIRGSWVRLGALQS